jgi:hypothetical protein
MSKYYVLSNAAGLIRTNKFQDKEDAICVASYRAEQTGFPIKIYEMDTEVVGVRACVLVCNPDGSSGRPEAAENEIQTGGHEVTFKNDSQAHMLLSAYRYIPVTTLHLVQEADERVVTEIEAKTGVDVGLFDAHTLHAYTEVPAKIKEIEAFLGEKKISISRVVEAAADTVGVVTAARKAHQAARSMRLPELSARASSRFGGDFKFKSHCEWIEREGKSPKIAVYVDGQKAGEASSEREAAGIIQDEAERQFKRFIKKEL